MSNHEWWWHFCQRCQKYFKDENLNSPSCSHCKSVPQRGDV